MLVAAVASPLVAQVTGWPVVTAFGVALPSLGMGAALAVTAYALRVFRHRRSHRAVIHLIITVATLVGLAGLFGLIMYHRSTGYFTTQALADGMAVLLALHLAGMLLRGAARSATTATFLADEVTIAVTLLLGAFWVLAALRLHYAAAPLLLVVAASLILLLVLRIPDALARPWVRESDTSRLRAFIRSRRGGHGAGAGWV